ncbi:Type 1 phosphatidylinositol 4,5-bisphosphate 4-phosphatase [Acipenser ruthenus]|uniref:Phosphatidylinositol-4,5-bisphosphate 4-phosphatase n=1 Tax=Acipenser ruthenus TaxID=7906 RepID=A0A444USA3_ACIRT|nr:Type 1 phosphatidylinositol 4,5-bisphosphate 4-phosphatase [Acipenser ruthenus]
MADGERSPLLSDLSDGVAGGGMLPNAPPYGIPNKPQGFPEFSSSQPSVLPGEDPPPYSPMTSPESGSAPMISCRVCQSLINVEGKMHQHVVKCGVCNEATFEARLAKQLKGLYWKLNWKEKEVKECIDGPEEDV